ncbi:MAG: 16S rRNA (adenine(1518)-N(6)/adenine(1519)-N(6))-dimethyltransferase RsmA [Candidatus Cloacimonadaceae bacterium]|nr:16S rRNA (adenine(1518)-N(6)/adenine(1519)-N(6))-dimethyltransferase RsmA [Candidatus Cloacimonadaceae bacterium]
MRAIKELGQNFLINPSIAAAIAGFANLTPGDRVWEIGPGMGILTGELIERGAKLTAFELDRRMEEPLIEKYGERFELVMQDILKLDWQEQINQEPARIKLVANIPYQITSPLLNLIERHHQSFETIVLMVQREVAHRLAGSPNNKDYGLMTIKLQLIFDIKLLLDVGREEFDPVPRVDSAVISLAQRKDPPLIKNPLKFRQIATVAFAHRRKTMRNNLLALIPRERVAILEQSSGIDLSRRGETLSEAEFIILSDHI